VAKRHDKGTKEFFDEPGKNENCPDWTEQLLETEQWPRKTIEYI